MKLTKQEVSMVKLAAATCAVKHMNKKASMQDILASYGIGLKKQAAKAPR